jgi:hypothetical protein
MVDALVRIGTTLQHMRAIAQQTGYMPDDVDTALTRLERLLDRLLPP